MNSNDLFVLNKLETLQNGVKSFEEQVAKTQMRANLNYSISNVIMSGSNWECQEPNSIKFPNLIKFCHYLNETLAIDQLGFAID